jgi:5-methyltetrahydropteroyltriglutamate--homocysteine methyltransferase
MEVAVGIIDVKSPRIKTETEIQEKIRELLNYLPAERLLICPSCGFGRRDLHIAIGKTKAMVSASQTIMA